MDPLERLALAGTGGGGPVLSLTPHEHIFLAAGQPWRYKGVTAFKLMELYRQGADIVPFLAAYESLHFNVLRVFRTKPAVAGLDGGWGPPTLDEAVAFTRYAAGRGWYVEHTLFSQRTDDSFVPAWREALAKEPGALVECVNEPQAHSEDKPDPQTYKTALLTGRAMPIASGNYDPPEPAYGTYLNYHSERPADPCEAARKAKGVIDLYDGWDPTDADPDGYAGWHGPIVLDEPPRADQFNYQLGAILAYFAIAGLLGAGATFHTLNGQFGQVPTGRDLDAARAASEGLNAFPLDTPNLGQFVHDKDDEALSGSLRTYRQGPYGVRVCPSAGWPILIGV